MRDGGGFDRVTAETNDIPTNPSPDEPPRPTTPQNDARPPSPYAPFWLYGVPILCLILMLLFWNQTRKDLASLDERQRQLAADLDAARGVTRISVAGAPALGAADQVVTLVEFSDYECPFCIRHFTQTMPRIKAELIDTGRVRYVFRDFPIDQLHPAAIRAHEAARCANEHGRFWELHSKLFSPPGTHTDDALAAQAREAGVPADAFKACLASGRMTAHVRESVQTAEQLGATGTPSFFVGVRNLETDEVHLLSAITGAQPYEEFEKAISAVAARVK